MFQIGPMELLVLVVIGLVVIGEGRDKRAVLKLVDAMLDTRRRATSPRAKKRKVS